MAQSEERLHLALIKNRQASSRALLARAKMVEDERKVRTRRLIQKGGVIELSGIEAVIGDDVDALLGLLEEARRRALENPGLVEKWKANGGRRTDAAPQLDALTRH